MSGAAWRSSADDLLARAEVEYDRAHARFDAVDGKAALVIGFAATLTGLAVELESSDETTVVLLVLGRMAAVLAVAAGLGAAWPRKIRVLKLDLLRAHLQEADPDQVVLHLMDQRIDDVHKVAATVSVKVDWLVLALAALAVASSSIGLTAILT